MNRTRYLGMIALASVFGYCQSGCEGVKEAFGLTHYQPNEYMVTNQPELFMPDDFFNHPAPKGKEEAFVESHQRVQEEVASERAQKTLMGNQSGVSYASTSNTEQQILEQAGGKGNITPDIRKVVDGDAKVDNNVSDFFTQRVTDWKKQVDKNFGDKQVQEDKKTSEK